MGGLKACDVAQSTFTGIELLPMRHKGQLEGGTEQGLSAAAQCYTVAV
jgi:hypothetical protein